MRMSRRASIRLACLAAILTLALGAPGPAGAQLPPPPDTLVVTISATPTLPASEGEALFAINVKNDSVDRANNVLVTIPVPAGTQFVKCSTSTKKPCTLSGDTVTTDLGIILAHAIVKVSLVLKMPAVAAIIKLTANANGDDVQDDSGSLTFQVLGSTVPVTFLPSLRTGSSVGCDYTITAADFQPGEDTIRLDAGLGCAFTDGLKMAASGKTLDLNRFKIVGSDKLKGKAGIRIAAGATNVTVIGGGTSGTNGIEYFDWCLMDEGGNTGLGCKTFRCFRARSAGIDLISNGVDLDHVLVDRAVAGSATNTAELPGGIGIHASGNAHIKDTIVRNSTTGIVADGTSDPDGDGRIALIDGNWSTSRVEFITDRGIILDGGPHKVKDTFVSGTSTATKGVVVTATAAGSALDGMVVKLIQGDAYVVDAAGVMITNSGLEDVAGDGFVITGADSLLSGNDSRPDRNGYVISGLNAVLDSNSAETAGADGYVLNGDNARLDNNSATSNIGRGYVLNGANAIFNTNTAEFNRGTGFVIAGSNNTFNSNRSRSNKVFGFQVTGTGNSFATNSAQSNSSTEWVIGPGNIDLGANSANGSRFRFGSSGGKFGR